MNKSTESHLHGPYPAHWKLEPFNEVLFDITGGQPKVKQSDYLEIGPLPVVDQGQSEIGGYVDDKSLVCNVPLPCILFGDHTKIFKWLDSQFALGADGVKVLATRDDLFPRYAFHYLRTVRLPGDAGYSRHFKFLKQTFVPLPPLPEQRRIAAILDKADAIRQKREEGIRLTEDLLRSTFLDMFGDPVTNPKKWPISLMTDVVTETQYGTAEKSNEDGDGIRVLRMNNITYEGTIDISDMKWCKIEDSERAKYTVQRGDLLFNRTNSPELVGKTAVWDRDESYAFAGYLVRVRFNEQSALADYVSAYLNSDYGKRMLFAKAKPSNNMSNFSAGEFCRITIPVPPISLQRQYAKIVENVTKLKRKRYSGLKEASSLFGSLVQRAFRGEL
jgi:type I restriction enzyme S subunit